MSISPVTPPASAQSLPRWTAYSLPRSRRKKYPAPISALPPAILHIGSGTYRERLVITRPNLILCGEGNTPSDVTIVWGDAAFDEMPEGDRLV